MSKTYRMKRPVTVEAIQYNCVDRSSITEILTWSTEERPIVWDDRELSITTMEGVMEVHQGDWVIKGVEGECYPCHPRIFEKTYEVVPLPRPTLSFVWPNEIDRWWAWALHGWSIVQPITQRRYRKETGTRIFGIEWVRFSEHKGQVL